MHGYFSLPLASVGVQPSSRFLKESTLSTNAKFYEHDLVGPHNGESSRVRLLKLEPLPITAEDHLNGWHYKNLVTGRLIEFELRDLPPYIALSYAWGQGTDLSFITLELPQSIENVEHFYDNRRFHVTRTLREALYELLQAVEPGRPIYVWTDAICINQGNFQERGFQVRLMGEIYSHASEVCIWLGKASRPHQLDPELEGPTLTSVQGRRINIDRACLPNQVDANMSYWWNRLWVVQEVYFAKSCPTILRWSERFTWDDFLLTWHELEDNEPTHALAAFSQLYNFQADYEDDPQKRLRLSDLLHWTSGLQSSDPHDTIYAVLGMAHPDDRDSIVPDYTEGLVDLYSKVTRRILETSEASHPLDLFAFFPRYSGSGSRSWCRDFSRSCNRAHVLFKSRSIFNVGKTDALSTWDQHVISKTTYVVQHGRFTSCDPDVFTTWGEEVATIRKAGVVPYRSNCLPSMRSSELVDWDAFLDSFGANTDEMKAIQRIKSGLHGEWANACEPCTLFITFSGEAGFCYCSSLENGKECAGQLRKGDKVVILRGASMPFVLRPLGVATSHTLVGACRFSSDDCKCRIQSTHPCLTRFDIV